MPPRETLLRQMRLDDQGHQNGQRFVWLENNQVYYNEIDSIDRTIPARNIPTPPLPIPSVQIYAPLSQTSLTIFRYPLTDNIYLKRPSFNQYNAVQSASKPYLPTLQVLEADFCELLLSDPHPNVAKYYGAVPDSSNEWIIGLAFKNYPHHLEAVVENYLQQPQYENFKYDGQKLVDGIEAGVAHIHSLGYAHVSERALAAKSWATALTCLRSAERPALGQHHGG